MKSQKNKVSRITIACNSCRSRKQKCSGKRPECEQCMGYNRICEWPEQLKRGPAKGYVEALEQRLHETEEVLLKVVSQLGEAQLTSILSAHNSFPANDGPQDKGTTNHSPLLHSRKRGVEYWRSFPLRDAESIQRWQQDCYRIRSTSSSSRHDEDQSRLSQPVTRRSPTCNANVNSASVEDLSNLQSPIDELPSGAYGRNHDSNIYFRRPANGDDLGTRLLKPKRNSHVPVFTEQDESDLPQLSSWKAAPSKEFQQQFLW